MRVIAGKAKRRNLITPSGNQTRPTTDRIKETLFNMLQPEVPGCRFLDLFSGSGGIAIEALSRGADYAVLVDNDRAALKCIHANLESTGLAGQASVMPVSVFQALRRLDGEGSKFDLIFMDPPYNKQLEQQVLQMLFAGSLLREGTLIVVEASLDTDISYMQQFPCELKLKEYKTNRHIFLRVLKDEGIVGEESSFSGEF